MAGPGPVLKEAHRLRSHIHALETKIAQAPRQLQSQKTKLQSAEETLKKAQDEIKQLKVKIHDTEVTVKATHQQIAKWEKQREGIDDKKQYAALNTEIGHAQERIKTLEDEVFEAMALLDEKTAQVPAIEAATKQVRADVAQFEKEFDARVAKLQGERAVAREELKGVDAQLPEDTLALYLKLVKGRGADALAAIDGRICLVCNTELTPQNASEVKRGMFVLCKSCGRILYA